MTKKTIKIGVISRENYKKRTIAIARGEYKPKRGEPKVWFESPESLKELEVISGRKRSNLSRTLKTMSRYGIVGLVKQERAVKPIVKATDFKVEFGLNTSYAS